MQCVHSDADLRQSASTWHGRLKQLIFKHVCIRAWPCTAGAGDVSPVQLTRELEVVEARPMHSMHVPGAKRFAACSPQGSQFPAMEERRVQSRGALREQNLDSECNSCGPWCAAQAGGTRPASAQRVGGFMKAGLREEDRCRTDQKH